MNLIVISSAPVFILLFYVYYRDKYEKEPLSLLLKSLLAGAVITMPIYFAELGMSYLLQSFRASVYSAAFNDAFMVAALCEEAFKLAAVMLLVWRNKNFNERFDGIVYAVFVSLGFALVENMMYVMGNANGLEIGLSRAITAVPAHAMFGIMMGYHLGLARFEEKHQTLHLFNAFFIPFLFHGIYDFILMSQNRWLLMGFAPLMIYLYIRVRRRMFEHSENSVFKPDEDVD